MGFQVAFESKNVFAQSNLSRQRVPGGWSSNRKSEERRGQNTSGELKLKIRVYL